MPWPWQRLRLGFPQQWPGPESWPNWPQIRLLKPQGPTFAQGGPWWTNGRPVSSPSYPETHESAFFVNLEQACCRGTFFKSESKGLDGITRTQKKQCIVYREKYIISIIQHTLDH